ncbi:thiol peroxidase [Sporosarcina thermotolerans]|uniref:Thiol peroxidase n=1 Tax=Sporosarcina thermotolerans TaxID=633404 RepID=A0AAW9AFR0_9BACL|nr:thiol peroxidase [Sporosarcina thermotolerans]MDW0118483.1 thiol peroxidase [Sporosarcina thermotolerans]WHT47740.1 thiol peroxidase [Sporosarcina thermotolerans]
MANVTFKQNPVTLLGKEVAVGDKAPDFTVLSNDLQPVTLNDSKGKIRLISVVPSLDTGVCSLQTKKFNEEAYSLGDDVEVLTISVDLPFAQARWVNAEDAMNVKTLSDHRDLSFGEAFGVAINELRLLTRSIFVIDKDDTVTYVEYVNEVTDHPDYEKAIKAVKELTK